MEETEPSSLVLDSERRVAREQFMFENLGKLCSQGRLPSSVFFLLGVGERQMFAVHSPFERTEDPK